MNRIVGRAASTALILLLAGCGSSESPSSAWLKQARITALPIDGHSLFWALSRDHEGRILAAGAHADLEITTERTLVARFSADGALDKTFGTDGMVSLVPEGRTFSRAYGVLVDSASRVVTCGRSYTPSDVNDTAGIVETVTTLARLLPDGRLDQSFGSSGFFEFPPAVFGLSTRCLEVHQYGDAYYVLGTNVDSGYGNLASFYLATVGPARDPGSELVRPFVSHAYIAKLDASGSLDLTFGAGGVKIVVSSYLSAPCMELDGSGRIYVMYHDYHDHADGINPNLYLARYLDDGTRDTSFGDGGHALVEAGVSGNDDYRVGLGLDAFTEADGKTWIGGAFIPDSEHFVPRLWEVDPQGADVRTADFPELVGTGGGYFRHLGHHQDGYLVATVRDGFLENLHSLTVSPVTPVAGARPVSIYSQAMDTALDEIVLGGAVAEEIAANEFRSIAAIEILPP